MLRKRKNREVKKEVISFLEDKGFICRNSQIYGGFSASWDYGYLGSELRKNIRDLWWIFFVRRSNYNVGYDGNILLAKQVWKNSGHEEFFISELKDCRECKKRFDPRYFVCPGCGGDKFTSSRRFKLMFELDGRKGGYLRPETAQNIIINFKNIQRVIRRRLPFGVAQIGRSFRNEVTLNSLLKTNEFEQMEVEFFFDSNHNYQEWMKYWLKQSLDFLVSIGISRTYLTSRQVAEPALLAHYSRETIDVEFSFPFGKREVCGVNYRADYDLKRHGRKVGENEVSFFDQKTKKKIIPHIVEVSFGLDRLFLALIYSAYKWEEVPGTSKKRLVLGLNKEIAPYLVAVLPLQKEQRDLAYEIYLNFKVNDVRAVYDENGSIGKRYRRQDEIGTPFCLVFDSKSFKKDYFVIRERDTMVKKRVKKDEVISFLKV